LDASDTIHQKKTGWFIVMNTLYENIVHHASLAPERSCIIEVETGRSLTYQQCLQATRIICQHIIQHPQGSFTAQQVDQQREWLALYQNRGYEGMLDKAAIATSEDHRPKTIFLQMSGGIIQALIWLSTLMGGHTLVPLAPDASPAEKKRALAMFKPDIIFVDHLEEEWKNAGTYAPQIERQECERWLHQPLSLNNDLLTSGHIGRVCVMTSGTTGEPKGVILTEEQILWTAEQVRRVHQLGPEDRGLTALPFFHVNAPVVSLCASLLAGATITIASRFSRRQFWDWIERYEITWASLVPTMIAILLNDTPTMFRSRTLRFVRTGSAPLPAAHLKDFEARFGVPIIETYGLSEAASMIVANPLPPEVRKPGSAGRPVGISLRICQIGHTATSGTLRDVLPGEVGEVCVQGPNVIRSYYGDAGRTSFQDGWFRTGDLGYLDNDGYLFLMGRLRAVINRGGENIAPREIEEVLQDHPAVREAAAIGRPDPIYGEQVVAYVSVREQWTPQLAQSIRAYAEHHLSRQKVPIDLIVLDELPKNRVGKLAREILKAREEKLAHVTHSTAR
jgi:acyl-CoA synthetase (AMP-forming)/AMP-acid ligase II